MPDIENWRAIEGYEDAYAVSDHGRVKSLGRFVDAKFGSRRFQPEQLLSPGRTKSGHLMVRLCRNAKGTSYTVHRLVLFAFVGPPAPGHVCLHRDGDHTNNTLPNLHWGTPAENVQDQVAHGVHQAARKTQCKHGHPLAPENTYVYPKAGRSSKKQRVCKTCIANRSRQYRLDRMRASNV